MTRLSMKKIQSVCWRSKGRGSGLCHFFFALPLPSWGWWAHEVTELSQCPAKINRYTQALHSHCALLKLKVVHSTGNTPRSPGSGVQGGLQTWTQWECKNWKDSSQLATTRLGHCTDSRLRNISSLPVKCCIVL